MDRTDQRIRDDVMDALVESGIEVSGLEIDASGQQVSLTGGVHSQAEKTAVGDRVAGVPGVLSVDNRLEVVEPERLSHEAYLARRIQTDLAEAPELAGEQIARSVEEALNGNDFVESENVQVRVESGRVVLSGTVSTWEAKKAAYDTAVYASGAEDVQDELEIAELK